MFAKSNLRQLPEYTAKKEEHGEWPTPEPQSSIDTPDDAAKEEEALKPAVQSEDTSVDTAGPSASTPELEEEKPKDAAASPNPTKHDATKEEEAPKSVAKSENTSTDTAAPSSSVPEREEEKPKEAATSPDPVKDDASPAPAPEPEPAAAPKPSSSSRFGFTDIRNLPPEELARLEEEQKAQRLAQQQQYQQSQPQIPSFPPIQPVDYAPAAHPPVAAFEERRWRNGSRLPNGTFAFAGWYRVARVNILAPHSAELVRMQQQKWERRDRRGNPLPGKARDADAWKAVLRTEWAVVKFEKLGDGGDGSENGSAPPAPAIEKLPVPVQQKSEEEGEEKRGDGDADAKKEGAEGKGEEAKTGVEATSFDKELEKMIIQESGKATDGDEKEQTQGEEVGSEKKENTPSS